MRQAKLALIASLAFASTAAAAQASLLGIRIGKPLEIAPCPMAYGSTLPELCSVTAITSIGTGGVVTTNVKFLFGHDKRPAWLDDLLVTTNGETVESILIETKGLAVQSEVRSLLVAKFGKPSDSKIRSLYQRQLGVFPANVDFWALSDATLTFSGVSEVPTKGFIHLRRPPAESPASSSKTLQL